MSTSTVSSTTQRTPAEWFAIVSAGVYLGAGLIGFLVTGFDDFAGLTDEKIIILAVNPIHNIVHLTLGAVYLVGLQGAERARQVNLLVGLGLLAAFVLGIAGGANFLNIDGVSEPDNWLHLVWGAASVWFARDLSQVETR